MICALETQTLLETIAKHSNVVHKLFKNEEYFSETLSLLLSDSFFLFYVLHQQITPIFFEMIVLNKTQGICFFIRVCLLYKYFQLSKVSSRFEWDRSILNQARELYEFLLLSFTLGLSLIHI